MVLWEKMRSEIYSSLPSVMEVNAMDHTATWENVYIFISSTFNDMHAERDYLIKRVFPAVRGEYDTIFS